MRQLFSAVLLGLLVSGALSQTQLFEDEVCKTQNGVRWICKKLEQCQTALETIRQKKPEICGFVGLSAIVCCEPTANGFPTQPPRPQAPTTERATTTRRTTTTTRRRPTPAQTTKRPSVAPTQNTPNLGGASKSVQKCFEYAKAVYQKPMSTTLILDPEDEGNEPELKDSCNIVEEALVTDGTPTKPREFPHQVNLGYTYQNTIKWLCTGSLISENFVLSAAHCSKTRYGAPTWAVVGDYDIESDSDDAQIEQLRIVRHFNHPNYTNPYDDIALYRLEKNVTFDAYKRPACLNTERFIQQTQGIATGWGNTRTGGPSSSILLKVRLDLIDREKCSEFWKTGGSLRVGIDDDKMICAGDLVGKKDTCAGDSGGPLQNPMTNPYCMYSVIGVTSFGRRDCGSRSPGVYTRVSHYLPWIEDIVWP